VACERTSADGFPQAPSDSPGSGRWNLAIVTAAGAFRWAEGNIGGAYAERDMPLVYGVVGDYSGWTVDPSSAGTRFTNIRSGHGMFVSIENTYAF
jgi:hypothetical protein